MMHPNSFVAACFVILPLLTGTARAQSGPAPERERVLVQLTPASTLRLDGDSTLHAFSLSTTSLRLDAWLEVPPRLGPIEALLSGLAGARRWQLVLSTPARSLHSGNAGLDANTHRALRADEHPTIAFRLEHVEARAEAGSKLWRFVARGTLSVAGIARSVQLSGTAAPKDGFVAVSSKTELLMSSFGIEPPTMFLGALRTDDRVVVRFDMGLKLVPAPRGAAHVRSDP